MTDALPTARIAAKLAEVRHQAMCQTVAYPRLLRYEVWHEARCTCDHAERVADLVRRMLRAFYGGLEEAEGYTRGTSMWDATKAMEAALAVPTDG